MEEVFLYHVLLLVIITKKCVFPAQYILTLDLRAGS
jgi:hypothetical protein